MFSIGILGPACLLNIAHPYIVTFLLELEILNYLLVEHHSIETSRMLKFVDIAMPASDTSTSFADTLASMQLHSNCIEV